MKPNLLIRFVALLLVPALIADPSLVHGYPVSAGSAGIPVPAIFSAQAFAMPPGSATHEILSPPEPQAGVRWRRKINCGGDVIALSDRKDDRDLADRARKMHAEGKLPADPNASAMPAPGQVESGEVNRPSPVLGKYELRLDVGITARQLEHLIRSYVNETHQSFILYLGKYTPTGPFFGDIQDHYLFTPENLSAELNDMHIRLREVHGWQGENDPRARLIPRINYVAEPPDRYQGLLIQIAPDLLPAAAADPAIHLSAVDMEIVAASAVSAVDAALSALNAHIREGSQEAVRAILSGFFEGRFATQDDAARQLLPFLHGAKPIDLAALTDAVMTQLMGARYFRAEDRKVPPDAAADAWLVTYKVRWNQIAAEWKRRGLIVSTKALVNSFMQLAGPLAAAEAESRQDPHRMIGWRRQHVNLLAFVDLVYALTFPLQAGEIWIYRYNRTHRERMAVLAMRSQEGSFRVRVRSMFDPKMPQFRADFSYLDPTAGKMFTLYQIRAGVDRADDLLRIYRDEGDMRGLRLHIDMIRLPTQIPARSWVRDLPVPAWGDEERPASLAREAFARCVEFLAKNLAQLPRYPAGTLLDLAHLPPVITNSPGDLTRSIDNRNKKILDDFVKKPGLKVVDLGSGRGKFLAHYRRRFPDPLIIGFDSALPESIDAVHALPDGLVVGDAAHTGLPDASVQKVTINHPTPPKFDTQLHPFLKEAYRILTAGGEIQVVTEDYNQDPILGKQQIFRDLGKKIEKQLISIGFAIESHAQPLNAFDPDYPASHFTEIAREKSVFLTARKPATAKTKSKEKGAYLDWLPFLLGISSALGLIIAGRWIVLLGNGLPLQPAGHSWLYGPILGVLAIATYAFGTLGVRIPSRFLRRAA